MATHAWIRRRDPLAGLGHLLVFYGFVVLFIGTGILAFQDDFAEPVLGWVFWQGWFYLGYSLFLDVFGFALIVGLSVFAVKRGILRPFRLSYWRPAEPAAALADEAGRYRVGDWLFLGSLLFLALTGFLLESFRIAADDPSFEKWAPFGWLVGQAFIAMGFDGEAAESARAVTWWVHGVFALFWVSSIPFTKAVHMLAGPAGVAVKDERAGNTLLPLPADVKPEEVGYATIDALSPKHLLDLDACTKCGKCHAACPATATGYPLSPRDLVLDLREVAEGSMGNRAALGIPPRFPDHADILGTIKPETLWSCMQCMACVEICPVGIEHVPIINQMRRALIERGEMDGQLQQTLETIYTSGNSFGEAKRKRARWTRDLDFDVKDIRKQPAELLWFVGDYASFDPRNQKMTQAIARVLRDAGVDFGILYDGERTAGNDVRRAGEEGLWTSLAEENVETIGECRFDRILTSDPHTFNTLKNEYPQLGGNWEVVHHSQLLLELLQAAQAAAAQGPRLPRHLPRPVHARALQRRLRRAPRGARGGRLRARRDAAEPRQLVLLRRRRRPHLDEGAPRGGRPAPEREPHRRGGRARLDRLLRRRLPEGRDHVRGRDQDVRPPGRDRAARDGRAALRVGLLPSSAPTERRPVSKETAFYPRLKALTDEWMDLFGYWAPTEVTVDRGGVPRRARDRRADGLHDAAQGRPRRPTARSTSSTRSSRATSPS